jgi:hypothetical protein
MKDGPWTGLYRPAHGTNPPGSKIIKRSRQITQKGYSQKGNHPATQGTEPVPLPGTADSLQPPIFGCLKEDAVSNGFYCSLKSWEKPFRAQSDNHAAARTSIPFEPNTLVYPIKIRRHMTMPPDLGGFTLRADFGTLPRIALLFFRIFLRLTDVRIIIFPVFCCLAVSCSSSRGSPPLFIKKGPSTGPLYLDNSLNLSNYSGNIPAL